MRNRKGQLVGNSKGVNSFVVKRDIAYLSLTQDQRTVIDREEHHRFLKTFLFSKNQQKFVAKIELNGKTKFLGYFDTAEEAHLAYCTAANELFSAFARCE